VSDRRPPAVESAGAYFRRIEETFVGLRGAPLLLSPADWQVARRWFEEGIPLPLVRQALAEVFAGRAERGVSGRIQSLRYCAPAIEAAWSRERQLQAGGEREEPPQRIDLPARLRALGDALPPQTPRRADWQRRILALASAEVEVVEERLAVFGAEILAAAAAELAADERREIVTAAESRLDKATRGRQPEGREEMLRRLVRQGMRRRLGLPILSLFSPEADEARG